MEECDVEDETENKQSWPELTAACSDGVSGCQRYVLSSQSVHLREQIIFQF